MNRGNNRFGVRLQGFKHSCERRRLGRLAELGDIGPGDEGSARAAQDRDVCVITGRGVQRVHQTLSDAMRKGIDRG